MRGWDLLGGVMSLLCLGHCLALPVVLASAPWLASVGGVGLSLGVLAATSVVWGVAIRAGFLRHGRVAVAAVGAVGLAGVGLVTAIEVGSLPASALGSLGTQVLRWLAPGLLVVSHVWNARCATVECCAPLATVAAVRALPAIALVVPMTAAAPLLLGVSSERTSLAAWTAARLEAPAAPGSYAGLVGQALKRQSSAAATAQALLHRLAEVDGLQALYRGELATSRADLAAAQSRRRAGLGVATAPLDLQAHVAEVRLELLGLARERAALLAQINDLAGRPRDAEVVVGPLPLRADDGSSLTTELAHARDVVRPALERLETATRAALKLDEASYENLLHIRLRILAVERRALQLRRLRLDELAELPAPTAAHAPDPLGGAHCAVR